MPVAKTKSTKADVKAAARKITAKAPTAKSTAAKSSAKREVAVLGDHPDTLGIIHRAMNTAARKAVAENDRLGIATPGTKDGKIVYRQPPKKRARSVDAG